MNPYWLFQGDCLELMRSWPEASVDAVVTDPPYNLGFMNCAWDKSGIAFTADLWREVLRLVKPGGHLLSFGGTRTWHRLACAIEDAGFEIRDSLHWFYGSGFPKSLNLGGGCGTALKPGHEPVVLARKPIVGNVASTMGEWGTGALNIDACRLEPGVGAGEAPHGPSAVKRYADRGGTNFAMLPGPRGGDARGRWPANVILDEDAAAELDAQTGNRPSSKGTRPRGTNNIVYGKHRDTPFESYGDTGGASRFFYCAKTSARERDWGCDVLPARTTFETVGRKPGSAGAQNPRAGAGRGAGAPIYACQACSVNLGGGRAATACSIAEDGKHVPVQVGEGVGRHNHHPTVKPVTLMRYLARLITPAGGVVLDPFMGSGSTGLAALEEGLQFIGIELDPSYLEIAKARLSALAAQGAMPQLAADEDEEGAAA